MNKDVAKPIALDRSLKGRPGGGDFFKLKASKLVLADGSTFAGLAPAGQEDGMGEVVFNTGMTGYVETLTDPSYAGQIIVFTFPLIGNYGALSEPAWESDKIYAAGVVVSEACYQWSHTASDGSLLEWLESQNIPIITDVDTRALTKHLRSRGTMNGLISIKSKPQVPEAEMPIHRVSVTEPVIYNESKSKMIILVDCGLKQNILRSLVAMGLQVKRVPYDYDYSEEQFDGVLISNGPGDPTDYSSTIKVAAKVMRGDRPMFGICLGSQLMGLAAGAKTFKLPFGHRGHNQPCITPTDQKCYITSQNHGYAIDENTLPKGWTVTFRNLNDGSIEGIAHTTKPFSSVQFHPEASPGPTDTAWLFNEFFAAL